MRLIGLDPGLRLTGWGVIDVEGNRLSYEQEVAKLGLIVEVAHEVWG